MNAAAYKHCNPFLLMETVDNDHEVFLQLHEIFLRDGMEKFERMTQTASTGDLDHLGRASHALKGTVGPLGANQLVKMLQEIEDECNHHRCLCGQERLDLIRMEMEAVKREMDHFVQNL